MKLRLLFTSIFIAAMTVVPTWASLQPLWGRSLSHEGQRLSLLLLALDLVLAVVATYLVLHFTLARPIARIETTVSSLTPEDIEGGSLLLRLDRALRRLALDLGEERRLNRAQLQQLTASHQALVKLQAELVANDRLATVGKLASGVAHEVGNPLAGILGYLSVIRLLLPEHREVGDVLSRIEHEVQRIDKIVRSLLDMGRPSRGQSEPVDARAMVDGCVKLLASGRDFSAISVDIQGPAHLWLWAEAGPLSQVLINLLINAAQAMNGKGKVTVRLDSSDDSGRIAVDDEGPGLSAEAKAHLFEPFFTTKAAGQGTGLGLAVSRHLLSQFGGQLSVENSPLGGARFIVTLPVKGM